MKRIIDGKTYNTETAEFIAEWSNGLGYSDFRNCEESLYKTKKGAFFIAGEGGAMSRWSRPCGKMTGGGDGIRVLTTDEALAWCENHEIDTDTIAAHFEIEEG